MIRPTKVYSSISLFPPGTAHAVYWGADGEVESEPIIGMVTSREVEWLWFGETGTGTDRVVPSGGALEFVVLEDGRPCVMGYDQLLDVVIGPPPDLTLPEWRERALEAARKAPYESVPLRGSSVANQALPRT